MAMFANLLSIEVVLKIFDKFALEGEIAIFEIIINVILRNERILRNKYDFDLNIYMRK